MELQQYIKGVWRWWWLILLSTSLAAFASYFASLQQPRIYQTTTTMIVGQVIQQANPSGSDFYLTEQLAESYAQIARRQPVLQATVDSLGLDISWQALGGQVNVYPIPRTQLLGITIQDTSPERAVAIADEVAHQLILQSPSSPNNQSRQDRGQFIQQQLDDLEGRIESAQARIKELRTELDTALSARQIKDLQTEISDLETLINKWQATYSDLLDFLQGGDSPNYLTVIESAQTPTIPISPKVAMNVLLAAAVGFVLAVGAALVLEYFDDTVKSTDELGTATGLNMLGSIGRISGKEYNDKLITSQDLFSPVVEAYRGLQTNLQFVTVDQMVRSVAIVSSMSGEGKSMTVANLGIAMAKADLRTILVDSDLRRPSLHKAFGLSNTKGLTNLFRSTEVDPEPYLKDTSIDGLRVITSGSLPPNPAELLSSQRMATLLQNLEQMADIIIFDTPPVLAVIDAIKIAGQVDGVVLVIKAKHTRRKLIREAINRLQQVDANLLGCLLNLTPGKGAQYYHTSMIYGHGSGQIKGQSSQSAVRRWWQRISVQR